MNESSWWRPTSVGIKPDLSWLLGVRCKSVVRGEHSWTFGFTDGSSLTAECPWRIVVSGRIALGGEDHGQQFGLPQPVDAQDKGLGLLQDRRVTSPDVDGETGDLRLTFEDATRLELFNSSSGYEGWSLVGASGVRVIAMGGGQLATFTS